MAVKTKEKCKSAFRENIHLYSVFSREQIPKHDTGYPSSLRELGIDNMDQIYGTASCGQDVYVCQIEEIPAFVAWLNKTYEKHCDIKRHI